MSVRDVLSQAVERFNSAEDPESILNYMRTIGDSTDLARHQGMEEDEITAIVKPARDKVYNESPFGRYVTDWPDGPLESWYAIELLFTLPITPRYNSWGKNFEKAVALSDAAEQHRRKLTVQAAFVYKALTKGQTVIDIGCGGFLLAHGLRAASMMDNRPLTGRLILNDMSRAALDLATQRTRSFGVPVNKVHGNIFRDAIIDNIQQIASLNKHDAPALVCAIGTPDYYNDNLVTRLIEIMGTLNGDRGAHVLWSNMTPTVETTYMALLSNWIINTRRSDSGIAISKDGGMFEPVIVGAGITNLYYSLPPQG